MATGYKGLGSPEPQYERSAAGTDLRCGRRTLKSPCGGRPATAEAPIAFDIRVQRQPSDGVCFSNSNLI
jgi:hypothetical protein